MEWIKAIEKAVDYMEAHITEEITITELAMKYRYDSPDSFAKAFSRFHGVSPSNARREKAMLKSFAPLKLTISLKGGYLMDYRITRKESFTVLASSREFSYENAQQEITAFWQEHYASGKGQTACGMFGINIDPKMGRGKFEYLIADVYHPLKRYSEWLPTLKEYELADGYCVEMYDMPDKYPKGAQDENYYTEIWIPVKSNLFCKFATGTSHCVSELVQYAVEFVFAWRILWQYREKQEKKQESIYESPSIIG